MRPETLSFLVKLTKGKNGLSVDQVLAICEDIRGANPEQLKAALTPASTKPTKTNPSWLTEMEQDRRRIRWTAAEAVQALIQLSLREGVIAYDPFQGSKKPPSFPAAAKKIAGRNGGDALAKAFSNEVRRIVREYSLA